MATTEKEMKDQILKDLFNTGELYKKHNPHKVSEVIKSQESRGAVLNSAIAVEDVLNKILINTGNLSKIDSDFLKKVGYIKNLFRKKNFAVSKPFLKKFDRVVELRHLYAHVPMNLSKDNVLMFSPERPYDKWVLNLEINDVKKTNAEFFVLAKEVLTKITEFLEHLLELHG